MQKEQDLAHKPTAGVPSAYDSNPFTSGWVGMQKLAKTNTHSVIGTALFNILLFVIMGVTIAAIAFSVVAFAINHFASIMPAELSGNSTFDIFHGMNDGSVYATWAIGAAVIIFVSVLLQTLALSLSVAAARDVSLKFGALLKASVRAVPPVLGLSLLILLAIVAAGIVLALIATVAGPISILFILLTALGALYASLRLAYATFAIIDLHLGPIAAAKHSWKISQGHLIETLGAGSVTMLVITIPSLVLAALMRVTDGSGLAAIFSLLNLVLMLVLIIVAYMPFAERYIQVQAVHDKQLEPAPLSAMNYLAIVLVLIVGFVTNAITPNTTDSEFNWPSDLSAPTNADSSKVYQFN